jgi:tripartite ATP-independent transporter DctM subunit
MILAWLAILLLAVCGAPLFVVIGSCALLGFYSSGVDSTAVISNLYRLANAPSLMAIPLFTFAGYLMAEGGTARRLVRISNAALGWLPGGVPLVALGTSAFFTAFTGASGVTIIALGGLLYPVLVRDRYPDRFSLGLLTTCGSVGLLLFPALPVILYGYVAKVDTDELFAAGLLPCIFLVLLLYLYSALVGARFHTTRTAFSVRELLLAVREVVWELPLPLLILFNFYGRRIGLPGGWFDINQAAALSAVWAFIVQVFIYRDLRLLRDVPRVARDSMVLVGGILVILGVAVSFTDYLIFEDVPYRVFQMIRERIHSQVGFLLALNLFLLVVGCLMDIFSAIIVVVPLILPLAQEYEVHPVHLGIVFLTNLEIGYLTPPVGVNLFISSFRFERPMLDVYRAALSFLALLLVALAVITYVPDLSLVLGRWLGLGSGAAISLD